MIKLNRYKLLAAICAMPLLASCDFEQINTNPLEVTEEEANRDAVIVGGSITRLARQILPVGTPANSTDVINEYQTAYNLSADVWSGYFSQNNNWNSGNNHLTYYLMDGWMASTYTSSYTSPFSSWKKIKEYAEKTGNTSIYALAQVLKISCWHKTLESFGPIPYTHAGEGLLVVPYDTEKEVYVAMFQDLKDAMAIFNQLIEAGNDIMPDFDPIYGGDVKKWAKYTNSLMLRLAIRLKYCDAALSKQWALEAYQNKYGVMSAQDDEAKMDVGAGYKFVNNIAYLADNYLECRVGTSLFVYLNAYKDPRLAKYCQPASGSFSLKGYDGQSYAPVPSGHIQSKGEYADFSLPNLTLDTPTYLLRASEVFFLLAEAALEWPAEFGNVEDWYKKGIEMSFAENGVSVSVDSYLNGAGVPAEIVVKSKSNEYTASAPTTSVPKFSGSKEEKLEKIMIQKWIALYPNGQEAWTEWRRTGYPKLNPVQNNHGSSLGITKEGGIRRMIYPKSFSTSATDKANYDEAVRKLKDQKDEATSRLWWDCR